MPLWTIAGSVLGTLIVVILPLNFRKPEKEPHHRVARHTRLAMRNFAGKRAYCWVQR